MLVDEPFRYQITEFDREVFAKFLPDDHPLVKVEEEIDWDEFRNVLENYYCRDRGQPAIDPLRMLKLEFLKYQYNLSDQQVMQRAATDLAFRYFLQVGFTFATPNVSSLSRFRSRLGEEGFGKIFDLLVAQARQAGLVRDRLRLKDASHVVASIAVKNTLTLVAQIRDRLLKDAMPFDAEWATGQQIEVNLLRGRTKDQADESRLANRVTHLRELVDWVEQLLIPDALQTNGLDSGTASTWDKLQQTVVLARKILQDRDQPTAGRKTLSVSDPEARRGKHGAFYEGYLTDILMDGDSEIITQINVLEAGGDEARDAVQMVRAEQAAHGNQIEKLSIDGAGFNGEMLCALEGEADNEDDNGLGVKTFVPPKTEPATNRFTSANFTMDEDATAVTCPAGETSQYRQRDTGRNATIFRFTREQCDGCPLQQQCVAKPHEGAFGRSVTKNDFASEYQRARDRAKTAEFASVRREHPAVERKLNEILNHHGGRRARYWGRAKVHVQQLMTGFVVNAKRIVTLVASKRAESAMSVNCDL